MRNINPKINIILRQVVYIFLFKDIFFCPEREQINKMARREVIGGVMV